MKPLLLLGTILVVLLSGCGHKPREGVTVSASPIPQYTENTSQQEIPSIPFPIYDFESFEHLLHKYDGKTYVINFWATWCTPCVEELPYFERIHAEQDTSQVKVILVSLDLPSMWKTRLEPFVAEKGLQAEVVILDDPKQNDWIPKVEGAWQGAIPVTLIYNNQNCGFYEGSFTHEELNDVIHTFINQ